MNTKPNIANLKIIKKRSSRFYFSLFFLLVFLILTSLITTFYQTNNAFQENVHIQENKLAQQEMEQALKSTQNKLEQKLMVLGDWDEIHQQLAKPSYYFYWLDERLTESKYFHPLYDQLEIYNQQAVLLAPTNAKQSIISYLPMDVPNTLNLLTYESSGQARLNIFQPILARDSTETIGYIGISIDFVPYLLSSYHFNHVDKESIAFKKTNEFVLDKALGHIQFKPIVSPITDILWQRIQNFIYYLSLSLIVISLLFFFILNRFFIKPLQVLITHVKSLKNSQIQVKTLQYHFPALEFDELYNAINVYDQNLQASQQGLKDQNTIALKKALYDSLTGVLNRRAFDEDFNKILHNPPKKTTYLLFDCDFFKAINDSYGHEMGDQILKIATKKLLESLPEDATLYRIGGDEFVVLLINKSKEESFSIASSSLHQLNNVSFSQLGIREKVAFSVGLSHTDSSEPNLLLNLAKQADIAMYKAKESHTEKVQCYRQELELETLALTSKNLINTVVDAIHTGNNFKLHFQAIIEINNKEVYYEALIRIQGKDELIYPNNIFSIVALRRLEVEMDHQIIKAILNKLADNTLPKGSGVSINIGAKTLLDSSFISLFNDFIPYLNQYKIVLEITENALINHIDYAKKVLNTLRGQGFLIALDDFGSGYSSIRYLANMPVDIVKFDMSMLHSLKADDKTKNIIQTTAKMVTDSGYDLVLEGVETEAEYQLAKQAGATHLQGYLYGKPNETPSYKAITN